MATRILGFIGACTLAMVMLGSSEAKAQYGNYGAFNWTYRPYYYDHDHIPYFALHPPVRYSYEVPRTYGYSPFAYSGNVMTPNAEPGQPAVVANPYAKQTKESSEDSGPLLVKNPYYVKK